MEEGTANTKPSLQQSAYTSAYAAAEPAISSFAQQAFSTSSRNYAIRDLTNLEPLPFAENSLASDVDYGLYSSTHDSLAASGNHTYANPWVTAHSQNHGFNPFVDPSASQWAENTFPAGAAYDAGTALPTAPGPYSWASAVAAGPIDQYADTNFQYRDPSLSVMGPYAGGIIGNGYGGQLPANGFDTHTSAAGAFLNASYAVDNGNSYGGPFPAYGFHTQLMAPDAYPTAFRTIDSGNVHGGQFAAHGLATQATTGAVLPNAFNVVDDNATSLGPAQVAPARHTCAECNRPFKRKGELKRHAKKHQADSRVFRCVAAGCGYSSYRKDKLDDHVKHRHAVTASAST